MLPNVFVSHRQRGGGGILLAAIIGLAAVPTIKAQLCTGTTPPCVLTSQYGHQPNFNSRQGYNPYETVLTPTYMKNGGPVQPSWSPLPVDQSPPSPLSGYNAIWAQPLYVAGISVNSAYSGNCNDLVNGNGSGKCNMLVVVTLTGSVFAFNAGGTTTPGAVIWSRQGKPGSGQGNAGNALWYDDCGMHGMLRSGGGKLPFQGIGATPVIDPSGSTPLLYLVNGCVDQSSTDQWYLNQIDLTTGQDVAGVSPKQIMGSVAGYNGADDLTNGTIPFTGSEVYSRSGLLEVGLSGASTSPLIYFTFGSAVSENGLRYHGWIFAYDSGLNQKVIFATTTGGCGTGSGNTNDSVPVCNTSCYCTGLPPEECTPAISPPLGCTSTGHCCRSDVPNTTTPYNTAQNWVGHSGGVWMDGRAPAAAKLGTGSSSVVHAYFGVGNGGFQQWQSGGSTPLQHILNWGESLLDFTVYGTGFDSGPSQYFVPYGGGPVGPPLGAVGGNSYAFAGLNQNDFDFAACGILLFTDSNNNNWVLTCDKAGYAYLLAQGDLCGATTTGCYPGGGSGSQLGFAPNDPGAGGLVNGAFVSGIFAANQTQCVDGQSDDDCDRITSMAFYPDSSPPTLIYWPTFEYMTTLQFTNNVTQYPPANAKVYTSGASTTIMGQNTTFTQWVVPGNQIVILTTPPTVRTVTQVSDTQLTVSQSCNITTATPFTYNGYFTNMNHDTSPPEGYVGYPGAAVEVTANGTGGTVIWGLVNINVNTLANPILQGILYAYDTSLGRLWCSYSGCTSSNSSAFILGSPTTGAHGATAFGLPTIVNGYVYIPNNGITAAGGNPNFGCPNAPSTGAPCAGLVVYSGN